MGVKVYFRRYWPLFLMAACMCCGFIWTVVPEADLFYMIATGQQILESGEFMRTAVWSIHESIPVVVQNGVWCVLVAMLYDTGGWLVIRVCACVSYILMLYVLYRFGRLYIGNMDLLALMLTVSSVVLAGFCSMRPQSITLIILIIEWIGLELYRRGRLCRKRLYVILCVMSVLIANIHASFHPFLLGVIGLFMFPDGRCEFQDKQAWIERVRDLSIGLLLVAIMGLLNPYGLAGLLYLFRSYNVVAGLEIRELERITICSGEGVICVAGLVLLVAYLCKYGRKASWIRVISSAVFLVFTIMHIRNLWMIIFVCFPLAGDLFVSLENKRFLDCENVWLSRSKSAICVVACVLIFLGSVGPVLTDLSSDDEVYDYLHTAVAAADYLDSLERSDIVLFNTVTTGSYLEFRGYRTYIDGRPELYESVGVLDELAYLRDGWEEDTDWERKFEVFLEKYGFTHFVFNGDDCQAFEMWLKCRSDIRYAAGDGMSRVYERIG